MKQRAVQIIVAVVILAVALGAIGIYRRDRAGPMGGGAKGRIDLADRTGWKRVDAKPPVLLLINDAGSTVVALPFATRPTEDDIKRLLSTNGALVSGPGSPAALTGTVQGQDVRGWLRTFACDDQGWMLVMYIETGTGTSENKALVEGAHCIPTDAADVPWPASSVPLPG